jgi:anti-sigma regulatory factor (Ser/Thr protein kinase)
MDSGLHISFNAEDRSYFAILKKEIHKLASSAGFSETKTGKVDIVVAEMTSNLLKHAGGGELLVSVRNEGTAKLIEIISIDNGPGISEPQKMMGDGISTANTLGHGLGSIKRLSDLFQIYSLRDWGTIVLSRIYQKEADKPAKKAASEVRAIVVAKPGEAVSGDGVTCRQDAEELSIFLGDGLGHGTEAHEAVEKATNAFHQSKGSPIDRLRHIHAEVRKTRGLVGTIASYSYKQKKWRICGIGNISTKIQNNIIARNCMSYNGIIGMNIPTTLKELEVEHQRGQLVIMCSDGMKTRWDIQKYTGITKFDLSILAAAIYKDFARKTDDMSVVVARINTGI